jgi:hypothetical protein
MNLPDVRPGFGVRRQAKRDAAFAWSIIAWPQRKAPSTLRSAGALQKPAQGVWFMALKG